MYSFQSIVQTIDKLHKWQFEILLEKHKIFFAVQYFQYFDSPF